MSVLRAIWKTISRGLHWFGDKMSTLILVVFYFTIFGVFALIMRPFVNALRPVSSSSNFVTRSGAEVTEKDLVHEG